MQRMWWTQCNSAFSGDFGMERVSLGAEACVTAGEGDVGAEACATAGERGVWLWLECGEDELAEETECTADAVVAECEVEGAGEEEPIDAEDETAEKVDGGEVDLCKACCRRIRTWQCSWAWGSAKSLNWYCKSLDKLASSGLILYYKKALLFACLVQVVIQHFANFVRNIFNNNKKSN